MAWKVKNLTSPVFLQTDITTLFKNSEHHTTKVENIHIHNIDSASPHTMAIWRATNDNGFERTVVAMDCFQREILELEPNESIHITALGWILDHPNDSIKMNADVNSKISVSIDGLDYVE